MSLPEESDLESEEPDETTKTKSRRRRVDPKARRELERLQEGRRAFLKKGAIGAGLVALGATLGYGSGLAQATGLSGNTRTVITDTEVEARVIGGVRIATEFIPDPVPAGTDLDPYPGSAIQAALNDGLAVYIPSGTWRLSAPITRSVDNATIIGAGKSAKLLLNGTTPCISAGTQSGWLIENLATDAGGVDILSSSQSRISDIWINGVLTDNRPIGAASGGGFYGVRASDFVTSGDGSPSNPYNASAIQSAISALPSRGGIVFVQAGVWAGTSRIVVPSSKRRVILVGEGTDATYLNHTGTPNYYWVVGTHVAAGFDCKTLTDFYQMTISPHPNNHLIQPCVKYIVDMNDPVMGFGLTVGLRWLGGVTIRDVTFARGDPGLWLTGVNVGGNAWQMWEVDISHCFWTLNMRGLKIDEGDSTLVTPGVFRGSLRQLKFQGSNSGGRTVDIQVSNYDMICSDWLIEDCSSLSDDYSMYIKGFGLGGVLIQNVNFGDASNAIKDAYIDITRSGYLVNMRHHKTITLAGQGLYARVRRDGADTGVVDIAGSKITVEEMPGDAASGSTLAIGTISNPNSVRIKRAPGSNNGFIGTTTPGGSPFTYTNSDASDEMVYLVGGTITDVSRGGQSIGPRTDHFLAPGDSITISYASPPTIKRFGVS